MTKVLITNVVALNGGDAAILFAILAILRRAYGQDLEVVVMDSQSEAAAKLYPDLDFQPINLPRIKNRWLRRLSKLSATLTAAAWRRSPAGRKALQAFAGADLVVSTGGTYLVEHYELSGRLSHLELAVASGTPTVLFTQSLGPFDTPTNQQRLRALLPRMHAILLRDVRSAGHLKDLGLTLPQAKVVADAVFALADPAWLEQSKSRALSPRPRIAVSVREWAHFGSGPAAEKMRTYAAAISQMVERLVTDHGAEVVFLSTCQGVADYRVDDSKLASLIAAGLPAPIRAHVTVDTAFHDPRDLMERLKTFDLVVATRMHMAILSLCAGTPVLPIAYEFKTTELFQRLGLGQWVQEIESVEPHALSAAAAAFLARLPDLRADLMDAVAQERQLALTALDSLPGALPVQAPMGVAHVADAAIEDGLPAFAALRGAAPPVVADAAT